MNYKLHIDISKGLIEAEGDKDFVLHVYEDFKDSVARVRTTHDASVALAHKSKGTNTPVLLSSVEKTSPPPAKKGKARKTGQPTINKNLNLYAEGANPSLKDFMAGYNTPSNQARNLLFVYYLKELKELDNVGADEVFTCYKHMGLKIPNIPQGLRDTAYLKGWLDTSASDDVTVTIAGQNAVSHELRIAT